MAISTLSLEEVLTVGDSKEKEKQVKILSVSLGEAIEHHSSYQLLLFL